MFNNNKQTHITLLTTKEVSKNVVSLKESSHSPHDASVYAK